MIETDILIIGAGASGLAAAYELSLVNKKIIVLEGRDRIGGRINSVKDKRFAQIVEKGAEFIHGKLPITLRLLSKPGIKHHLAKGKMWEIKNGEVNKSSEFIIGWERIMKHLHSLENDMPIATFLNQYFSGEKDSDLRESVLQFVQGYDAADATKASSFALRDEWGQEDDDHQERIDNGYIELMNFLAREIKKRDNDILLSQIVKNIQWEKGRVEVITAANEQFIASKVLITIPLGVWQHEEGEAYISFTPELTKKQEAAQKMGFGAVIKIHLQFQDQFWEDEANNKMKDAGFIFSDGDIPTWWTQEPVKTGMLTGWMAGPRAMELKKAGQEEIYKMSIQTLAYVFGVPKNFIKNKLVAYYITNWTADPFALGAYAYATMDTHWAKDVLCQPIEQALYFAGEALYNGAEAGTVEGALASGIETAHEIIASS